MSKAQLCLFVCMCVYVCLCIKFVQAESVCAFVHGGLCVCSVGVTVTACMRRFICVKTVCTCV